MLKISRIILVGISALLLSCQNDNHLHKTTRFIMGTIVEATVVADETKAKQVTGLVFDEMKRIENLTSFYNPSELTRINEGAGKGPQKADPELLRLVGEALPISERTDGAFDPTVGPLSRLWQFSGPGESRLPSQEEIDNALTKVGWKRVTIDLDNETISLPEPGMALDLGGIAKGYTLNRVAEIIKQSGIRSALVNIGGDILALGEKAPGKPWLVGVEDPRNPKGIIAVAPLKDRLIVTSGDYQRFFIKEEKRYHHILDPKTGYPADKLQSVTIVGPIGSVLQPAGTASFVLGVEKGISFIESLPDAKGFMIDAEGKSHPTAGAEQVFEIK